MIETNTNPIRSRINMRQTERAIKELTSGGVPRWASHPLEFKNWALEVYAKDKEDSIRQVSSYRMEEQETLTDEKARMVGRMGSREFIEKLRANGVRCFTYQVQSGNTPATMVNTVGLWCVVPGQEQAGHIYNGAGHQYMTWMDIPFMFEWSVLRLDPHQLPIGEKYRGWRTVLSKLIRRKVFTEQKAHEIFGIPSGATSKIYKRTLYDFRNGRLNEPRPELQAS